MRSEGFDFDDGWAPGYRSAADRVNPLQTDQEEPSLVADRVKFARDLLMDRRPGDIIGSSQKPTPTNQFFKKPTLQRDETITGSEMPNTNSPDKSSSPVLPELRSVKPVHAPTGSKGSLLVTYSLIDWLLDIFTRKPPKLVPRTDPNEFEARSVIQRKVGPEYYSRFAVFREREKELKQKGFFFRQPYVAPTQKFR